MRAMKGILVFLPLAFWGMSAMAGDVEAGKAVFEANCADCHDADDFAGESADDIVAMIKSVTGGQVEHKGDASSLSDEDIANIAAFWASAK
jgi:mono/diheme cytochrome c family protein